MQITTEYLQGELENLSRQKANALSVAQQAEGAIALIQSLLARLDAKDDAMTLSDLRDALGAQSAEIVTATP
jgi:hypothetical protein